MKKKRSFAFNVSLDTQNTSLQPHYLHHPQFWIHQSPIGSRWDQKQI